ncbi:phosphonate C-P lyase system protein PhnH [Paraburkholderia dinghuensis]|uniref:Phosphonate C-P lyase system protein PhnH n=1 Tax=Paraburkholderia dinghuensis TaxID=2305225 RepID=A0A3N6PTH2_9BURK|nr:phosphonate C-P lyase system protein PhnH [Paraburkholderia dinghuensis]RQH05380.1 phosphonate C-P lyase system protein PhnH [Paraburkholderia dinghuensis]
MSHSRQTSNTAGIALDTLAPGFADPVHDTHAVFRTLLDALARPGRIGVIETRLPAADAVHGAERAGLAAFASLLALCDYATPVWLAQPDEALAAALRFHAGAPLTDVPALAAFAYVHDAASLPPLETLASGTPESPEQSATVFVRVDSLTGGASITLRGPGIEDAHAIAPAGLPERFWQERTALAAQFPCGIDIYLVCGDQLVGLPRTTYVEMN